MKKITLIFKLETDSGKKENFVIKNIKENITEEEINVYANKIIQEEYLAPQNGAKYISVDEIIKTVLTEEKMM